MKTQSHPKKNKQVKRSKRIAHQVSQCKKRTNNKINLGLLVFLTLTLFSSILPIVNADDPGVRDLEVSEISDDLKGVKIAILDWSGALIPSLETMLEYVNITSVRVKGQDIRNGCLENYDILVCPGGSGSPFEDLGLSGIENIRDFVNRGGGYYGTCAGALFACDYFVWQGDQSFEPPFNGTVEMGKELNFDLFSGVGYFPIEEISVNTAVAKVNLDRSHPITENLPDHMHIFYAQSPYLEPHEGSNVTILGTYDEIGKPAIVAFEYGMGRVFLSGPHPEYELDSFRDGSPPVHGLADEGTDWVLAVEALSWLTPDEGWEYQPSSGFSYYSVLFGLLIGIVMLLLSVRIFITRAQAVGRARITEH